MLFKGRLYNMTVEEAHGNVRGREYHGLVYSITDDKDNKVVGQRPTCNEQRTMNNARADVPCPRRALPYAECCKAFGLGRIVRAFPIFNYPFSIKLRCPLFIVYCSLFIGINIFA